MPIIGVIDSSKTGNLGTPAFYFIAGASLNGLSTYTFSSIPQTYKHLHIRMFAKSSRPNTNGPSWLNVNGDTTPSNYTTIYFYTAGTSGVIGTAWSTSEGGYAMNSAGTTANANVNGSSFMTIYNYTDTNKFKNGQGIGALNNANSGDQVMGPAFTVWKNTNAITSLSVNPFTSPFLTESYVALYGLKG
jgi:hypothetical protein